MHLNWRCNWNHSREPLRQISSSNAFTLLRECQVSIRCSMPLDDTYLRSQWRPHASVIYSCRINKNKKKHQSTILNKSDTTDGGVTVTWSSFCFSSAWAAQQSANRSSVGEEETQISLQKPQSSEINQPAVLMCHSLVICVFASRWLWQRVYFV